MNVNPVLDELVGKNRFYSVPSDAESQVVAVAMAGSFESYYTENAPPGDVEPEAEADPDSDEDSDEEGADDGDADGSGDDAEDAGDEAEATGRPGFLTRSPETRLTVIGDAELFSERFFRMVRRPQAELESNLQFALNLVDWSLEDADMISIRSRGAIARPLEIDDVRTGWIEALNYLVPLAAIIAIGVVQFLGRRNRRPMTLVGTSS